MTIKDTTKKKGGPKGAKINQSTEVDNTAITPHIELPTIAERIKQEVAKFNLPLQKIAALKKQLKAMEIEGVADKKGYAVVDKFRKDVKGLAVLVEKTRVQLKADYLAMGRGIDEAAKGLATPLREIEKEAEDKLAVIDNELERVAKELEESKAAALKERIDQLEATGLVFNGVYYVLGDINVGVETIQVLTIEQFAELLDRAKDVKAKLDEQAENKRKEEERQRQEQEQERQRLEQQRKDQEDREKRLQEQEDRLAEQQRQADHAKHTARQNQLLALGLIYNPVASEYQIKTVSGDVSVPVADLKGMELADWDVNLEMVKERAESIQAKEKTRRQQEEDFNNRVNFRNGQLKGLGFAPYDAGYYFKNVVTDGRLNVYTNNIHNETPAAWDDTITFANDFIAGEQIKAKAIEENKRQEAEKARKALLSDTVQIQEYIHSYQLLEKPILKTDSANALLNKFQDKVVEAMKELFNSLGVEQ